MTGETVMRSKSAALAAVAVAIAGTGLIATAGTASAAPTTTAATTAASAAAAPAAAYNGACGSGYGVVNSAAIGDLGTVYLTYSAKTGKNCVVTVRNTKGTAVYMRASVRVLITKDTQPVVDEGQYTKYAGPVYVTGKGHCIEWSGDIEDYGYYNGGSNCGSLAGAGR